ncbi:major facilitator superfamily domain-containing protein [Myxozyma melibiosi]|uniref:Major facilitator superfamily domain-containing protein n=1 Tax=Myxozyma melibiosi TaxID=54550 RepID=A0ABR1F2U2_9ASCO
MGSPTSEDTSIRPTSRPASIYSSASSTPPLSYQSDCTTLSLNEKSDFEDSDSNEKFESVSTTYETFVVDRPATPVVPLQDVGIRPWVVVIGGFCAQVCSYGMLSVVGIFLSHYKNYQLSEYTTSEIAWIGSTQSFFFAFSGVFCGRLVDMYGPYYVTIPGMILQVGGLVGTAFGTKYVHLLLGQGFCCAIGAGGLFYGSTAALTSWFSARRGLAFGIAASGAGAGGISFPFLLQYLFYDYGSFTVGVCTLAGILGFLGLIVIITTTTRLPPTGAQPYRFVTYYIHPFKDSIFALFTLAMSLIYLALFVPKAYVTSAALYYGMSRAQAAYLLSYLNGGSFVARIFGGYLFDRFNKFLVFFGYVLFGGLVLLPGWYSSSTQAGSIVVATCFGFASGGILALCTAVIAQISPAKEIGTRVGACNGVLALPALFSLPVAGAIVGDDDNYRGMQAYAGSTILAGAVVSLFVKYKVDGFNFRATPKKA